METIEDIAPADRQERPHRGRPKGSTNRTSPATKANQKLTKMRTTLIGYHAGVGAAIYMANHYDGEVIIKQAENCAEGLLAIGKEYPQVMHVLEILCFEMWWMPALVAYGTIGVAMAANHQVLPRPLAAFVKQPLPPEPEQETASDAQEAQEQVHGPWETAQAPAPENVAPSTPLEPFHAPLGSVPDEGLPHGAEIMIREAARRTGRPYDELRQEVMVQIEQERLRQNGKITLPAALGQPIIKE